MRVEAWIFGITAIFFALVAPAYWVITDDGTGATGDWTGTTALVMTCLLVTMVALYLGFHAKKMDARPEDRGSADIAEGAGELGFFPPYSWWPLWVALTVAVCAYAIALTQWWLLIIGLVIGFLAVCGWVFEFYRGEHAH